MGAGLQTVTWGQRIWELNWTPVLEAKQRERTSPRLTPEGPPASRVGAAGRVGNKQLERQEKPDSVGFLRARVTLLRSHVLETDD